SNPDEPCGLNEANQALLVVSSDRQRGVEPSAFARPSSGLPSRFVRALLGLLLGLRAGFVRPSFGLCSAFVRPSFGLRPGVTATSRASLRPPRAPQAPQGCSPLLRARNLGPHADLVRFRPRGRGRCPARRSSARTTRRHRRCTVPNTSRTSRSFRVRRRPHAASPSHGLRDGAKLRISLPLRRRCTHGAPPALPAAP